MKVPTEKPTEVCLRLQAGTELLGEFDGDALIQRQHMIKRADGQMIQVTSLLYAVIAAMNCTNENTKDEIAKTASETLEREIDASDIDYLVQNKIAPMGILHESKSQSEPIALLSLRFRKRVVPEYIHRTLSTLLMPLFNAWIVRLVVVSLLVTDIWIAVGRRDGLKLGIDQIVAHPTSFLLLSALTAVMGMFHELGHATATRYGGARPGVMGVGLYLVWPVFYTDVNDSYRLDRKGRLRTDLGGVYFNVVAIVLAIQIYAITGFTPLLIFAVVSHFDVLYQFLPFVRLDGYWILSDVIGVPNLFAFMKPVMAKMVGSGTSDDDARLAEINSRAKHIITAWVIATFVFIAGSVSIMLYIGPYFLVQTIRQLNADATLLINSTKHSQYLVAGSEMISLLLLAAPLAGVGLMCVLLAKRAMALAVKAWPNRPMLAIAVVFILFGMIGLETTRFMPAPQRSQDIAVAAPMRKTAPPQSAPAKPNTTSTTPVATSKSDVSADVRQTNKAPAPVTHSESKTTTTTVAVKSQLPAAPPTTTPLKQNNIESPTTTKSRSPTTSTSTTTTSTVPPKPPAMSQTPQDTSVASPLTGLVGGVLDLL